MHNMLVVSFEDYEDYLSDLDLDDCYAQKEDGEDDYDTLMMMMKIINA